MSSTKCVVEGCNSEYDVVCSFSFYNTNSVSKLDEQRQKWIEGAMQEDSEVLWRHVSLQLCGYHFEVDAQGLWIDSPVLPELLSVKQDPVEETHTEDPIMTEHNYCLTPSKSPTEDEQGVSRLNVRQLVDSLGYLSLKNLQRKQLWVVKVESDSQEASITQAEQVIAKMSSPTKIIELIPPQLAGSSSDSQSESYQITEESIIAENFIYEIAGEQEICMDEVKDMPQKDWSVNILSQDAKPKYAFINCNTGKKKRHFTTELTEVTFQNDFDNYYILPDDVDTSVGVEVTTSNTDPDNSFIVDEYNIVLDERPKKRQKAESLKERKKKRMNSGKEKERLNMEIGEDWIIENNIVYDDDDDSKVNPRVRRKNKKYLGYDFVT